MREMVDTFTSRSAQVGCAASMKTKYDTENRKRGYQEQIEGSYPGGGGVARVKIIFSNQKPNSRSVKCGRSTQEDAGIKTTIALYPISAE